VIVCTTGELHVKEIDAALMLATFPAIGVKLLTKIDTVYKGLVADTAVPFLAMITAVTVVPNAACKVGVTWDASKSLKKSICRVDASNPFT
jgi:hypothetical protein